MAFSDSQLHLSPRGPSVPPLEHRIKRKPVAPANADNGNASDDARQKPPLLHISGPSPRPKTSGGSSSAAPLLLSPRPPLTSHVSTSALPKVSLREGSTNSSAALRPSTPSPGVPRAATDNDPASSSVSAVQKAYGEACHFLGGLINHPTESSKHFTILRHSHGIVFYRGSTTSVTVSIFSDAPLPSDRTLWLQSKGYTGKTGMKAKALFRLHGDWVNVTPSVALHADQVDPASERAWQRDITKFRKKAPARVRDAHQLRETVMARIPVEAGDGYFQLVLCQDVKKKVLCYSPVFRVLSTSADPSSIRGASLSTLPLEFGAMVLSSYAQTVAQTFLSPVASRVQNKVQSYQPSAVKQTAGQTAFSLAGLGDRVGSFLNPTGQDDEGTKAQGDPGNLDQGPVAPFPMDFKARWEPTAAPPQYELQDWPVINLTKVADTVLERLHGHFICWARFHQSDEKGKPASDWHQSVLSVLNVNSSTMARVDMSHITKRTTTLRILEDIPLPPQVKVQVRVLCFIRPEMPPPNAASEKELLEARQAAAEAARFADTCDASYAQAVLDHPAWGPNIQRSALESRKENMSLLDRTRGGYAAAWTRLEKTPLHWIGVRSETAQKMDQQVTVNGFYIVR